MAIKEQQDIDPFVGMKYLRAAPTEAGIALPPLRTAPASPAPTFVEPVHMRADASARPAEALQKGGRE
ncbi:hypothetical protein OG244_22940 [Streptomyces brevispora]|uniref:hypothetical protein n=1 Tax=Streptomyces brevispora TaxID=887462 RepID=UPI002E34DCAC|nr:hypothetical protein [Streptomyces brevispora]